MTKKADLTISAELLDKLNALPDNRRQINLAKQREVELAIEQFYPQKSISGIAMILGVDDKYVNKIAQKMGKK